MRRLASFLGVLVIGGLLVSSAYAGGKGVGIEKKGMSVQGATVKVEVVKGSLVDAMKMYFSARIGVSLIRDRSEEPARPDEPQRDWGYRPGVGREYVLIRDNGGTPVDK